MKKRIVSLIGAAVLTAGCLAGCGAQPDGGKTTGAEGKSGDLIPVTMAFCTWTGYSPMFIAKEKGYFEEAGINMDIQVIEDESTYASLITRGSIQFLATAVDPNIKMFANGADDRYVLTMDNSNGADGLVAVEGIETLDDLAGRTVALDKSASSYYFFLKALEADSNLTEADVQLMDMGDTTEAGLAFMAGNVDAAIMWEPELSEALEMVEGAHTVITSADYPDTIMDSLVVNTAFAAEHPEVVDAVEEAWYRAVDFLLANPDEAHELMASGFEEVTAEDIAADCEGLDIYGRQENEDLISGAGGRSIKDISQEMADFWMEKGECDSNDLSDFFLLIK
ncbi:MAG: ABC transporter substrate-binding protein [Lachnospiraceae bacterium]|nr:ABC transporter substrate-binding protein [Lachnospiraceae bacterium]